MKRSNSLCEIIALRKLGVGVAERDKPRVCEIIYLNIYSRRFNAKVCIDIQIIK
jgi:hypothetical protein